MEHKQSMANYFNTAHTIPGLKTVRLHRAPGMGFGFTLRHFIVYPQSEHPTEAPGSRNGQNILITQPMDTVFVKEVNANSPAFHAGLNRGDRLLSVNGIPVAGIAYTQIVQMIQQTPTELVLQVVPKERDILQAYFGETAHNPETNARVPNVMVWTDQVNLYNYPTATAQIKPIRYGRNDRPDPRVVPPQSSNVWQEDLANLRLNLDPKTVTGPRNNAIYATVNKVSDRQPISQVPRKRGDGCENLDPTYVIPRTSELGHKIEQNSQPILRQERNGQRISPNSSMGTNDYETIESCRQSEKAIQRLRKSVEQKEEFLRGRQSNESINDPVRQREFYGRPSKLPNSVWPPPIDDLVTSPPQPQTQSQSQSQTAIDGTFVRQLDEQQHVRPFRKSESLPPSSEPRYHGAIPVHPINPIVQERAKQFEHGRALSPEGSLQDRTLYYRSELSRLNKKQAVPNVAERRKEFEQLTSDEMKKTDTDKIPLARSVPEDSMDGKQGDTMRNAREEAKKKFFEYQGEDIDLSKVVMRNKLTSDIEKPVRRVSYLKATQDNIITLENDPVKNRKATLEDLRNQEETIQGCEDILSEEQHWDPVIKGYLMVKKRYWKGNKCSDRSWRTCVAEIRGPQMYLTPNKDSKSTNQVSEPIDIVDLRYFKIIKSEYTKRKNVIRLYSSNSQHATKQAVCNTTVTPTEPITGDIDSQQIVETDLLLSTNDAGDMELWRGVIKKFSEDDTVIDYLKNAESSIENDKSSTSTTCGTDDQKSGTSSTGRTARKYLGSKSSSSIPQLQLKAQKKLTTDKLNPLESTSSDVNLASPKELSDKETNSPKQKTWRGLMARQLKKIHGGHPNSSESGYVMEGASMSVPLEKCPPSLDNEYVPLIVAKCTQIVESRGLSVIGIYRIPGNTAAISALTDQINKGLDEVTLSDPKWEDVHVVSSLLKAFIRSLPDALVPRDMYSAFIAADQEKNEKRYIVLKSLIERLPKHSYETLKHLIKHLSVVSSNVASNKMDPKNLAIVFGPSIVRNSNEKLETAVKDMKHQCTIVESLVTHNEYFFENGQLPVIQQQEIEISSLEQTKVLLNNIAKIEGLKDKNKFTAKFVQSSIKKGPKKDFYRKSAVMSLTPDTVSLDSSTSNESKDHLKHESLIPHDHLEYIDGVDSAGGESSSSNMIPDEYSIYGVSETPESESMSLDTVTLVLDKKLRSLRNNSSDSEGTTESVNVIEKSNHPHHPLILEENIPYADESPERSVNFLPKSAVLVHTYQPGSTKFPHEIKTVKPLNATQSIITRENVYDNRKNETVSDDTDSSTTSNPRDKCYLQSVLREINHPTSARSSKLNRSLSLNYRSHRNSGIHDQDCCCNRNHCGGNRITRLSTLTKDEKTDKNINKKRQIADNKNKRYSKRSIKRRHTVGGPIDYCNDMQYCRKSHHPVLSPNNGSLQNPYRLSSNTTTNTWIDNNHNNKNNNSINDK